MNVDAGRTCGGGGGGFRLNVLQLAEALAALGNLAAEYQSPQAFAARVQAEAIRLGMAAVTNLPP